MKTEVHITHIDTACILLEIGSFRILTDPTLDPAGDLYYHGFGAFSRKTSDPGITKDNLGNIDLVLLSHHQHRDNLDREGRKWLETANCVLSTIPASKAIKNVTGLQEWQTFSVCTTKVSNLRITAIPAQHRPWWLPEWISGKVLGFVIEYDDQEGGVIYVAGDTVFFRGIREVANRFKVNIGIFNVGAVQFPYLTGLGKYTMDGSDLIKAVEVLKPKFVIPVHSRGWTHFKEPEAKLKHLLLEEAKPPGSSVLFLNTGERTMML